MKILCAIPCMDSIPTPFVQSLMSMTVPEGVEIKFSFHPHSLIYDARNKLADTAIFGGYDYVLWLDSDVVFDASAFERLFESLGDKDLVSGVYYNRRAPFKPCIFAVVDFEQDGDLFIPLAEHLTEFEPNTMVDIQGCGFGFVLTSVKMLADIKEKEGLPFSPILGFGEDLSFCFRAWKNGYKLYANTGVEIGHISHMIIGKEYSQAYAKEAQRESTSN